MSESYQIVRPTRQSRRRWTPRGSPRCWPRTANSSCPCSTSSNTPKCAIDDLIDVMGRATIEAVLRMSAEAVAGPKQQGKKSDREIVYHGRQEARRPQGTGDHV